jgi:hypothetical protein
MIQDGYHFIGACLAKLAWLIVKYLYCYSGYDFGYFVNLLTAQSLPTTEDAFFNLLKIWFPTVYDIKYLMKASKVLKGGLQEVADDLGVCYGHYIGEGRIISIAGYANRSKPTSRVGFTSHSINLLQNARDLF